MNALPEMFNLVLFCHRR